MKKTSKILTLVSALALCAGFIGAGAYNLQADAETATPDLYTHGGSVRTVVPTGLRFLSSVSEEYKDSEVGTLIILKAALGGETLDHNQEGEDLSYVDVPKTQWSNEAVAQMDGFEYDGSRYYFNAVLSPIPDEYYGAPIVARAYAKTESGYVYGDPVERSIAQVAAAALAAGEQDSNGNLLNYVDTALANKTLSMNLENSYMVAGNAQTLDILNDNNYLADWTSSDESVATVDANGKVTAKAEGKAKITAKLGSQTFTSNVQVGTAPAGEKIVDFSADNVNTIAKAVADGNGNGACEISVTDKVDFAGNDVMAVKVTSGYARVKLTFPDLSYMKYEKVQFYAYVEGQNQYVTGAGVVSNGVWTKAEVAISGNTLTIDLREKDWNSNKGGLFYISDMYGVNPNGFTKVLDINSTNINSTFTQTAGGGTPSYTTAQALPGEDGSMLVTVPTADSYARVKITNQEILSQYLVTQATAGYQKLAIAVYLDASESSRTATQLVAFGGGQINLVKSAWTWLIIDAPDSLNGNLDLRDSEYWQSTGMKFYVSDIYAFNPTNDTTLDKVCDFNAENVNVISYNTYGNNGVGTGATVDSVGGVLRGTVKGNFVDTYFNTSYVDLTGYTKISFAVYTAGEPRTLNVYKGSSSRTSIKSFSLTKGAWTIVTIDIPEGVTDLGGFSLRMYETTWGSRVTEGEVYYISDIYGIK